MKQFQSKKIKLSNSETFDREISSSKKILNNNLIKVIVE